MNATPMPHDTELERAVLGLALRGDPACLLALVEDEQLFYDPRHQLLHDALVNLTRESAALDLSTVTHHLIATGELEQAGGPIYLAQLATRDADVPATFPRHLRILRRQAMQRQAYRQHLTFAGEILNAPDPESVFDAHLNSLLETRVHHESLESLEDLAGQVRSLHDEARTLALTGREYAGLDCGFPAINRALNGLCPGELTVIAGRTAMGKTTLALQMAYAVARTGTPVGLISLEMTGAQVYRRLAHFASQVDPDLERRGQLQPVDNEAFEQAVDRLQAWPLRILTGDRTVPAIRARIERLPEVRLWIVDHLHRLNGYEKLPGHERYNRYAHELANLSVDKDIPLILVAQLNRDCEDRPNKMPNLSDLRASGGIEEHAVNVLLLYRPAYYQELVEKFRREVSKAGANSVEIEGKMGGFFRKALALVEKTRFGPTLTANLAWSPSLAIFEPAEQSHDDHLEF